jgi:hypothetical protein
MTRCNTPGNQKSCYVIIGFTSNIKLEAGSPNTFDLHCVNQFYSIGDQTITENDIIKKYYCSDGSDGHLPCNVSSEWANCSVQGVTVYLNIGGPYLTPPVDVHDGDNITVIVTFPGDAPINPPLSLGRFPDGIECVQSMPMFVFSYYKPSQNKIVINRQALIRQIKADQKRRNIR